MVNIVEMIKNYLLRRRKEGPISTMLERISNRDLGYLSIKKQDKDRVLVEIESSYLSRYYKLRNRNEI